MGSVSYGFGNVPLTPKMTKAYFDGLDIFEPAEFDFDGPELLPCPFCGGRAYYRKPFSTGYAATFDGKTKHSDDCITQYPTYAIECVKCGAPGVSPVIMHSACTEAEGKAAIAERWNRRADI